MTPVILSDGEPCDVRQLSIFELDSIAPAPIGPFMYKMQLAGGGEADVVFDPAAFDEPPIRPGIPESEIKPGTPAWYDLRNWQMYQAALTHEYRRIETMGRFVSDVSRYILGRCIAEEDVARIVSDDDWREVYRAALIPPVTMELLGQVMDQTYRATFDDKPVLDALDEVTGGHGKYNAIRAWENELMVAMDMSEAEYASLPVDERARKIVALKLSSWIDVLENHRRRKQEMVDG